MVIFLHGDDTFRSREKLRALTAKFLREVDPSGMNLVTIDGTTAEASDIWGAIAAQSFLVRKRMVVIERLGERKSSETRAEVAAFLNRIPEDVIVVFYEAASRTPHAARTRPRAGKRPSAKKTPAKAAAPQSDALFTALLEGTFAQEFVPLDGVALTRWVGDVAKARGATIAPDALRALCAEVGADLWRMSNEIEKLTSAAAAQRSSSQGAGATRDPDHRTGALVITHALVRDLVTGAPTDNIFAFVDAVGSGDRAAALRHLRALEEARVDPQYLLAMLARQFRLLVAAAELLAHGTPPAHLAAELAVAPFVAQKIAQQARRASAVRLRDAFLALAELDRALKSSRAPWQALIEIFCLDATAPPTR